MTLDANSLSTNLLVTGMVALLVIVLPLLDGLICRRLGLNLWGGVSTHPQADRLLKIRQAILTAGPVIYMCIFAWLVFFSRSAMDAYVVHVAPLEDLKNAFRTDHGFSDVFSRLFTEGFTAAFANVRLVRPEDIAQFYMNVMVFVPMGYLLPYVFGWFRANARVRPVVACFILSLATENLQLIFRRGFYDLDDLLSNTLGGFIGQMLFISIAYVVTHPDWRRELKSYHRWRRHARHMTLYPFARKIGLSRTTLLATYEEAVWDFYVDKLGFRVKKQVMSLDDIDTRFLLVMGSSQVEIICFNKKKMIPVQYLTISARNLVKIKKRLEKNGIEVGEFHRDPYTELRCLSFTGPDRVCITGIEQP